MLPRQTARPLLVLLLLSVFVPLTASAQSGAVSTARLFEAVGVREGSTVCEIGAGDGAVTIAAAKAAGPSGQVYSSELGVDRVQTLRRKVGESGLTQITVVAGDATKTNFPDGGCDAVFMRDVYHHFTNPAAMNGSILQALKPGARLAVVDFTPPPGSEAACPADRGKDGMHGITLDTLSRELKEAGFEPVSADQVQRALFVVVARPEKL
jgi:SAM-dependent methyltransferase